jgi:hypothetical protein
VVTASWGKWPTRGRRGAHSHATLTAGGVGIYFAGGSECFPPSLRLCPGYPRRVVFSGKYQRANESKASTNLEQNVRTSLELRFYADSSENRLLQK